MPTRFLQCQPACVRRLVVLLAIFNGITTAAIAQEESPRLIDRPPFDRITLKAAAGGELIDVMLLDLPNRKVPSPLPVDGDLELRRLAEPSVQYLVPWTSIAKVETYKQLLLAETQQLIEANEFAEAFFYLGFLNKHYPNLKGLSSTTERYLKRDALHSFSEKRYEDAISILTALHDFNPQHNGLASAVDTIIDRTMKSHLADRDFAAARRVLDSTSAAFPKLNLKSKAVWQKKFENGAIRQIQVAQRHFEKEEFYEARNALRRAIAILPDAPRANEMFAEINRLSPQVVIGVTRHGSASLGNPLADMSALRISRLVEPKFIEMVDFGPEGGIYSSPWANFLTDDSGTEFNIQLKENAAKAGVQPDILAMHVLDIAKRTNPNHQPTLSGLLKSVAIADGQRISLQLRHPHVRPEALLPMSVRNLTSNSTSPGAYEPVANGVDENLLRYDSRSEPVQPSIVERVYTSEEAALTSLLLGDIDVLERVAPWQIDRLSKSKQITISNYRLPTVHVLLPNYSKPLLRRREFRRALCYGIDRQKIVNEIILGGRTQPGFQVLSGPLPVGSSRSDPLGYGYKHDIPPRPYEPRLAAVLAAIARTSVEQHDQAAEPEGTDPEDASQPSVDQKPEEPKTEPLILAYPPSYVAQTTCQSIKRQLDAVGIPIKLLQLSPYLTESVDDYDLRYTELAIWEPSIDIQQLLGPKGIAGRCSPAMSLALDAVDQARNWQESRTRLHDLHDVAFYDLPIIPLWQTINSFAYRKSLQGISNTPISLYQDVANWKITSIGAE